MNCSCGLLSSSGAFFSSSLSSSSSSPTLRRSSVAINRPERAQPFKLKPKATIKIFKKPINDYLPLEKTGLLIQIGAFLASVEQPAFAVTGNNNFDEDPIWTLIQWGFVAVWYFLIMPPVILNWLRLRWYKRLLLEMYLQFMCVFLFFPGLLLWVPFLNFRRLPRDPSMKYPWSTPQDPSINDPKSL